LSYSSIQNALQGLETKKVIQKSGETTRKGTLYRIFLPEEIEVCRERMRTDQIAKLPRIDYEHETDFFNIKENRIKIFERDGYKCNYCGKQLTRFSATLDHIQPISQGGDNSYENLITSCLHCNSKRGARPIMDAG
jgi:5-methylcytosine-specific restriction endonuclease McrA